MSQRAEVMGRRLDETAGRLGVDQAGRSLIAAAYRAAMTPRLDAGVDDHHADFFHPARTALILMDDAAVRDPRTLAAALLLETRSPELRAEAEAVAALGGEVTTVLDAVPDPALGERLLEALVVAPAGALQAAVAERLDHARHLHMRPEGEWAGYHAVTCAAYAPAAARAHPRLEERLAWWCTTFRERFLERR